MPRPVVIVAGLVVIAVVAIFIASGVRSCVSGVETGAASAASATGATSVAGATYQAVFSVTKEPEISYVFNSADMLSLPDAQEVSAVNSSASAPPFTIGSTYLDAINEDVAAIEKTAPCGFVFMDLQTGRAITYHSGKVLYCASATKAPLVYYALTHAENDEGLSEDQWYDVEGAIVWSDNDLFFDLCQTYFNDGYLAWLAQYGVETPLGTDDYFPTMSANALGAIWGDIFKYLQTGAEDAQRLAEYLSATEESYIRDGLKGTGASVLDKAGWMYDAEVSSVSDAGIVQLGGRSYLMVIVTEQSEVSKSSRANDAQLARDLFNARGLLAPHITVGV